MKVWRQASHKAPSNHYNQGAACPLPGSNPRQPQSEQQRHKHPPQASSLADGQHSPEASRAAPLGQQRPPALTMPAKAQAQLA